MAALEGIRDALGLDDAGVDFAVCPDCDLLLFEANATMVVALLRRSIASLRQEKTPDPLRKIVRFRGCRRPQNGNNPRQLCWWNVAGDSLK